MGWIELLVVCLIPASIKLTREFGKLDLTIVPASFLVLDYLFKKLKDFFTAAPKHEEATETKTVI